MNFLDQAVSSQVHLSMQGVDTTGAKTFADVIRILLEQREKNPGNPEGKTWAERQGTSINLPLRSAIVQQVTLNEQEMSEIRRESISSLTEYKLAQLEAGKENINMLNTEKEIQEWMGLRIVKALQKKVEEATRVLIGEIPLIGFHMEETVAAILEWKIHTLDRRESQWQLEQEQESELALAA